MMRDWRVWGKCRHHLQTDNRFITCSNSRLENAHGVDIYLVTKVNETVLSLEFAKKVHCNTWKLPSYCPLFIILEDKSKHHKSKLTSSHLWTLQATAAHLTRPSFLFSNRFIVMVVKSNFLLGSKANSVKWNAYLYYKRRQVPSFTKVIGHRGNPNSIIHLNQWF